MDGCFSFILRYKIYGHPIFDILFARVSAKDSAIALCGYLVIVIRINVRHNGRRKQYMINGKGV